MNFDQLASIERELVTRNAGLHSRQYGRKPETLSPSGVVVSGYAGHLFIADGGNMWEQQLAGCHPLSPEAGEKWLAVLHSRAAKARQLGVRVAHLIAPEKQIVLPTFRWQTDMIPDISNRPLWQIVKRAAPDTRIIYPAEDLAAAQPQCELFWRGNSHWCASGCIIAAQSLLRSLLQSDTIAIDRIPLERAVIRHDLSRHFPDEDAFEEVIRIRPAGGRVFDSMTFQTTGHYGGSRYVTRNMDAPIQETLVIFGDSYACDLGLTAALTAFFADVHFVWSKNVIWTYVEQTGAKYVVWESAERFLILPPNV